MDGLAQPANNNNLNHNHAGAGGGGGDTESNIRPIYSDHPAGADNGHAYLLSAQHQPLLMQHHQNNNLQSRTSSFTNPNNSTNSRPLSRTHSTGGNTGTSPVTPMRNVSFGPRSQNSYVGYDSSPKDADQSSGATSCWSRFDVLRIDNYSRIIFPSTFLILNLLYWGAYTNILTTTEEPKQETE